MKYQQETCPLCDRSFICKVGNVSQCQCAKVELTIDIIRFLKDEFNACLCIDCLRFIKNHPSLLGLDKDRLIEKVKELNTRQNV